MSAREDVAAANAHDDKGRSEEKCLRCGWVMGREPLNCQNDNTAHEFPSTREYADAALAALPVEVDDEAIRAAIDNNPRHGYKDVAAVRALLAQHTAAKDPETPTITQRIADAVKPRLSRWRIGLSDSEDQIFNRVSYEIATAAVYTYNDFLLSPEAVERATVAVTGETVWANLDDPTREALLEITTRQLKAAMGGS